MKNKLGKISGFIVGVTAFLLLFKIFILDKTLPSDELAPGIVLAIALVNGLIFGFIGAVVQRYVLKKRHRMDPMR